MKLGLMLDERDGFDVDFHSLVDTRNKLERNNRYAHPTIQHHIYDTLNHEAKACASSLNPFLPS